MVRMASGKTGTVLRQGAAGRWVIRWTDSGTTMAYTAEDIASRMTVGAPVSASATPISASSRGYARRSRCPNPRDCGDPTCDGQCGH